MWINSTHSTTLRSFIWRLWICANFMVTVWNGNNGKFTRPLYDNFWYMFVYILSFIIIISMTLLLFFHSWALFTLNSIFECYFCQTTFVLFPSLCHQKGYHHELWSCEPNNLSLDSFWSILIWVPNSGSFLRFTYVGFIISLNSDIMAAGESLDEIIKYSPFSNSSRALL